MKLKKKLQFSPDLCGIPISSKKKLCSGTVRLLPNLYLQMQGQTSDLVYQSTRAMMRGMLLFQLHQSSPLKPILESGVGQRGCAADPRLPELLIRLLYTHQCFTGEKR
jgi:hypothetical protein